MSRQRSQAPGRAHLWLRGNVLGLVAIFLALNGTAVALQVAGQKAAGNTKAKAAKKKKKARRGPPGPAGPQGATGPQGPSGSSSGPAGGDLAGSYPNPLIADGVITDTMVAAANKDGLATVPSLRTLGTGAQQAAAGNDSRLSDSRTPTGSAGGTLAGTYPSPTLNVSGGPCPNGQALTDVSALAALTCNPGVFSDTFGNIGVGTAFPEPTGTINAAVGVGALQSDTSGGQNSALGFQALGSDTTGHSNSAVGRNTMFANTTGDENSAMGQNALDLNTTGSDNSALGFNALPNGNGGSNTGVGAGTLAANTGASNTALGANAGQSLTTGNQNIDIGSSVTGGAGESNTIRIGGLLQDHAFIAGIAGQTTAFAASPVLVDGAGQLGTTSSSRRFKKNIRPLGHNDLGRLMELKPVSFLYKQGSAPRQFGLIAEQVARLLPNLVVYGEDGKPSAVAYQELPALLLAKVQQQQRQIRALRSGNARVDRLQRQVEWLMRHR